MLSLSTLEMVYGVASLLFASPELVAKAYDSGGKGVFYDVGDWNLFLANLCGILWIIGWVSVIMVPYFILLNALGLFRVDSVEEEVGLDISHHKGSAYDMSGPTAAQVENYEISTSQRKMDYPTDSSQKQEETA